MKESHELGINYNERDTSIPKREEKAKGKKGEKYNNEEREREAHREPEQDRMLVALCSLTEHSRFHQGTRCDVGFDVCLMQDSHLIRQALIFYLLNDACAKHIAW